MIKLNLPEYKFRFRKSENGLRIFDSARKKFVSLTPEEWVRQNFIQYLIQEKKYPASLIAVETGLRYNRLKKRSDILVFDRKGNRWMLVECKSYKVKISEATFRQVAVYNMSGKTKTKYLAVTNGLKHYCCKMNYPDAVRLRRMTHHKFLQTHVHQVYEQGNYVFLKEFPGYE